MRRAARCAGAGPAVKANAKASKTGAARRMHDISGSPSFGRGAPGNCGTHAIIRLWPIGVYSPYKPGESRARAPSWPNYRRLFGRARQPILREDERHRQRDRRGRSARARRLPIAPEEARAAAQPAGAPYDQLMALYPPRTPGTDAFIRIYNNDGSEAGACGNGMRCVADLVSKETGKTRAHLRDHRRHSQLLEGRRRAVHRRHGQAALHLERDPAGGGIPRHPRHRIADRPDRQAGAAFALGGEHGQSARHLLGRRRQCLRPRKVRAAAGEPSDLSRARQHHARADRLARAHHHPHLGARRRADARPAARPPAPPRSPPRGSSAPTAR